MDRHDLPVYVYERFAKSTHHLEPKLRMSGAMPPLPIHGMYKDRLPLPAEYIIIINNVRLEPLKSFHIIPTFPRQPGSSSLFWQP